MFDLIAFDADDTLWENNIIYIQAEQRFERILAKYPLTGSIRLRLAEIENQNIQYFGYGVMGFILSLAETAVEITGGKIYANDIQAILRMAKEMITAEIRLFDQVETTLRYLYGRYQLILITKGDLTHQQSKINRSGLLPFFSKVHILADKNRDAYKNILDQHSVSPSHFLMVGDSVRSDINPVLEIGGWAVYVPNNDTWSHEKSELSEANSGRFFKIDQLGQLPALLKKIDVE